MTRPVDLVVCAYGRSPWLDRCLASLSRQVGPGVALWVTTSTPEAAIERAAAAAGARLVVNPRREGIASDWNFALSTGEAPLVVLCHQDDEYAVDYASRMAAAFDSTPDVLFAACDHVELDEGGLRPVSTVLRIKRRLMRRAFRHSPVRRGPGVRRRLLSWGNPVSCPGVMIHRALVPDFRFDSRFSSNLDWDAWDRLARRDGSVAYVDAPLVGHRVHVGSATTALINDSTRPAEDREMLARYWPRPIAWLLFQLYRQAYRSNGT